MKKTELMNWINWDALRGLIPFPFGYRVGGLCCVLGKAESSFLPCPSVAVFLVFNSPLHSAASQTWYWFDAPAHPPPLNWHETPFIPLYIQFFLVWYYFSMQILFRRRKPLGDQFTFNFCSSSGSERKHNLWTHHRVFQEAFCISKNLFFTSRSLEYYITYTESPPVPTSFISDKK